MPGTCPPIFIFIDKETEFQISSVAPGLTFEISEDILEMYFALEAALSLAGMVTAPQNCAHPNPQNLGTCDLAGEKGLATGVTAEELEKERTSIRAEPVQSRECLTEGESLRSVGQRGAM